MIENRTGQARMTTIDIIQRLENRREMIIAGMAM
jgi:hypothetical protein